MSGKELLHHLFDWEVAPGVARTEEHDRRAVTVAATPATRRTGIRAAS